MMLFASDVLSRRPGAEIVFDVKCSGLLAEHIARLGGRPVMWKTGHSLIKSRLKQTGAPLAGEMSGHVFFADRWYGFDDAIYSAGPSGGNSRRSRRAFIQGLRAASRPRRSTPELRIRVGEGGQVQLVDSLLARDLLSRSEEDGPSTDCGSTIPTGGAWPGRRTRSRASWCGSRAGTTMRSGASRTSSGRSCCPSTLRWSCRSES